MSGRKFWAITSATAVVAAGLAGCSGAGGGGGEGGSSGGSGGGAVIVLMVNNPQMVDLQKLTASNFAQGHGHQGQLHRGAGE